MNLPDAALDALDECLTAYSDTYHYALRDVLLVWAGDRPATLATISMYETPFDAVLEDTAPFRTLCDSLNLAYAQTLHTVSDDKAYFQFPPDNTETVDYLQAEWAVAIAMPRLTAYDLTGEMGEGAFLGYPDDAIDAFQRGDALGHDEILTYGRQETEYDERTVRYAREYVSYHPTPQGYDEYVRRGERYRETILDIADTNGIDASTFLKDESGLDAP